MLLQTSKRKNFFELETEVKLGCRLDGVLRLEIFLKASTGDIPLI